MISAMAIDPPVWFVLRIVAGLCFSGSYMIIESWINGRVTNETRGAIFSVYLTITQLGMIAGQYVIVFAAPETETPFMIAAILFALAIGFFAWGETPLPQSFLGGAVIMASGIFIWWRERRLARRVEHLC